MNKQSDNQKKLVQIFKAFFEKAIIPQLKKIQGSLTEWIRFSSLLSTDNFTYDELQLYVDKLPSWPTFNNEKPNRKSEAISNQIEGFQSSKTLGLVERNRLNVIISQTENFKQNQSQKEDSLKQRVAQNNQTIFLNLDKILKNMEQNQTIVDNILKQGQPQPQKIRENSTNQVHIQSNSQPHHSQSYNYIPVVFTNPQIQPMQMMPQNQPQGHPIPYMQTGINTSLNGYQKNYY